MAQTATTPEVVYADLLLQLRAAMLAGGATLAASRVEIMPVLEFEGITTPMVELIVPGQGQLMHPDSGVGVVNEEFQVAYIEKISRDELDHATFTLSDASKSILELVKDGRGDASATPTGLLMYEGESSGRFGWPVVLLGWSGVQRNPMDPSFLSWIDRYRVIYETNVGP